MTPRGHRTRIVARLAKFTQRGDLEGLRAYIATDAFMADLLGSGPEARRGIMAAYVRAQDECERKEREKHPAPQLVREKDGQVSWKAPGMAETLRATYARAKSDEAAARLLGISAKAFRSARLRYLDAHTTA